MADLQFTVLDSSTLVVMIDVIMRLKEQGLKVTAYTSYAQQIMDIEPISWKPQSVSHDQKCAEWRAILRNALTPIGYNIPSINTFVVPCEAGHFHFSHSIHDSYMHMVFHFKEQHEPKSKASTDEVQAETGQLEAES